jgi:hypothetical protein
MQLTVGMARAGGCAADGGAGGTRRGYWTAPGVSTSMAGWVGPESSMTRTPSPPTRAPRSLRTTPEGESSMTRTPGRCPPRRKSPYRPGANGTSIASGSGRWSCGETWSWNEFAGNDASGPTTSRPSRCRPSGSVPGPMSLRPAPPRRGCHQSGPHRPLRGHPARPPPNPDRPPHRSRNPNRRRPANLASPDPGRGLRRQASRAPKRPHPLSTRRRLRARLRQQGDAGPGAGGRHPPGRRLPSWPPARSPPG